MQPATNQRLPSFTQMFDVERVMNDQTGAYFAIVGPDILRGRAAQAERDGIHDYAANLRKQAERLEKAEDRKEYYRDGQQHDTTGEI